jgi:hypothetical protein
MTTSLAVRYVYKYAQGNQALISFSPVITERKIQRGLLFVLDLIKIECFLL